MTDNQRNYRKGKRNITIWQQNINKSHACQHDLISSGKLIEKGINIVALQEPSINTYNNSVASRDWKSIYPSTHTKEPWKTQSLILIRDELLTDGWEQVDFPSGDVAALKIHREWGTLTIFNIYNDCKHNEMYEALMKYHREHTSDILGNIETHGMHHLLWLGDFNRHHLCWDTPENNALFTREALDQAEILIQGLAELGLEMALATGIPTHEHCITKRWSRLDQVFSTEHTVEAINRCEVLPEEQGVSTDHFPIIIEMDLAIASTRKTAVWNFKDVSWNNFQSKLAGKLAQGGIPNFIKTQGELNTICSKLTSTIQETITEIVPLAQVSPHAKRWWTKELTELRQSMLQSRRKASQTQHTPGNSHWENFKEVRCIFGRELEKAKRNHWRD